MQVHFLHYPHLTVDWDMARPVVAIGVFDGLHVGHRRLIAEARALAEQRGCPAAVFTFIEHPRGVLRPDLPVALLTPWPEKRHRMADLGLDACVAAHFTLDLAEMSPEAFVQRILVDQLHVDAVVTGFNFHFGQGQAGNPTVLAALGDRLGFPVHVVPPFDAEGGLVSSSRLRALIAKGEIGAANALLGRPYTLVGEVVAGDRRGRTIGFPTANIQTPPDKLLPAYGVYAGWAMVRGERVATVVNVGLRPTFDPPKLMVEAHLFDWDGDLYGEVISVDLHTRIRAEKAFPSVQELVAQITADCAVARAALGVATAPA